MITGIQKTKIFLQKPFVTNTGGLILLRGTNTGVRIIVLFVLARAFTPEYFGTIIFALAAIDVAKMLADFGIDTIAVREFASISSKQHQEIFARTVTITKILFGSMAYLLLTCYLFFTQSILQLKVGAILGILILTSAWNNLALDYFQARLQTAKIAISITTTNIFTAIVFISLLLTYDIDILIAILIFPITDLIILILLSIRLKKEINIHNHKISFRSIYFLIKKSFPIAITAIIVTFYTRLDVFFLNNLYNSTEVGYYGIAFRLTEPFQLVAVALSTSIFSQLSKVFTYSPQEAYRLAKKYGLGIVAYGIISCLLIAIFFPIMLTYILPAYAPSTNILRILSIALIFRTTNGFLTSIIQAQGYFSRITLIASINMVIIVTALLLLVPSFGAVGASIALLIGELFNTLFQSMLLGRIYRKTYLLPTQESV